MIWERNFFYAANPLMGFHRDHWAQVYQTTGAGGKFWLDLGTFFKGHNCLISRNGEWTSPWPFEVVPGFEMPRSVPNFSPSFADITDARALSIRDLIHRTDTPVALFYSGGIDSTICLAALLRNLNAEELKKVHVCMSAESIQENPSFFEKHIYKKMNIIDSAVNRYSEVLAKGFYAITADQGDCLFGTEAAIQLYHVQQNMHGHLSNDSRRRLESLLQKNTASEIAYTEFADLIRLYFHLPHSPDFGTIFYERVVHNIKTASVPIHSLHDFFWWIIFNLKYMHCALRCVFAYSGDQNQKEALQVKIINWFNHPDYQRWSLANNNNGQKIQGSTATGYKWAGRQYIYEFDKNEWYFQNKMKLASLGSIIARGSHKLDRISIFGMDNEYRMLRITDSGVQDKAEASLAAFQL